MTSVARSIRTETLRMFVDGRWVGAETGETFPAVSPGSGQTIATVPKGTREDAAQAALAAYGARERMARLGAFERARLLHRMADAMERRREELACWLTKDQGKPYLAEAVGEVGEAVETSGSRRRTSSGWRPASSRR